LFAVIRSGGRQYHVREGGLVRVQRLAGEPGDSVELGEVLLMGEGDDVTIGAPTIAGARVMGTIRSQARTQKIVVFRYKAKTRSRKKTGHRQAYTELRIDDILAAGAEPKPKAAATAATDDEAPKTRARGRRKAEPAAEPAAETAAATTETPAAAERTETPAAKPKRSRKKTE
jgi:large subunit ribosomal protein L21